MDYTITVTDTQKKALEYCAVDVDEYLTNFATNRARKAKDEIIEGDKAAGSYDKIMISDVCVSLSRKREDKVNGTGRFHIMKNRYGVDGLTFGVKANTSTGHFEIKEYDESEETPQPTSQPYSDFDNFDKKQLHSKFFELKM